jgi:HK97 gp10 family phage protein
MLGVSFDISGVEATLKMLRDKTLEVQDRALGKALDKAGDYIAKVARGNAPKSSAPHMSGGRKVMPGNLKKSIARLARYKGSLSNQIRLIGARSGKNYSNDGWYIHFVERGTSHSRSNPFMENTHRETKGEAVKIVREELTRALRRR